MKKQASASKPVQRKAAATSNPEGITEGVVGEGAELHLQLPGFEGPFDLLLHLIEEHELDILNIPVAFVTERYLHYLALMQELNIDVASDYLVMAATLAHLKSRLLLPTPPADDDADGEEGEQDPRAELIRRLLEYQKYKQAAEQLAGRSVLGRDSFTRGALPEIIEGPAPLAPVGVFKLFDAFQKVLERAKIVVDHQIEFERLSITDRINQLVDRLSQLGTLSFDALFDGQWTRPELVVTFLALLEMTRLRLIEVRQEDALGPIMIELAVAEGELTPDESAQVEPSILAETAAPGDEEVRSEPLPLDETDATGDEEVRSEPSVLAEMDSRGDEEVRSELSLLDETDTVDYEEMRTEAALLDETDTAGDEEVTSGAALLDETDTAGDEEVTSGAALLDETETASDEAVTNEQSLLSETATSIPKVPDADSEEVSDGEREPREDASGLGPVAGMDTDLEKGSE